MTGLLLVLAFSACSGSGGGPDREWPVPYECPFPFSVPREHTLIDEMNQEHQAFDLQVLCTLVYGDMNAQVFLKAEPTGMEYWNVLYTAREAYLCRNKQVEQLPEETFYYEAGHHGWDMLEVALDELLYVYGWSEICVGWRPCTYSFDTFDVLMRSDGSVVAEKQPATCVHTPREGNPRPLVPQVRVPAEGDEITFSMGSNDGDPDERPVHEVFIRPVRVDVREATNMDYALFLNDHGNDCDGHPCISPQGEGVRIHREGGIWKPEPEYEDHPVVQVTWHSAQAYCMWRWSALPTEAEWEMAASGAGTRLYPWGDESPTCELALFDPCVSSAPEAVCSRPTGRSREGVCDLSGSVSEWVGDWYQEDFYSTCMVDCREPRGPTTETGRKVVRGGGFDDPAASLRAADRGHADPASSSKRLGVRCGSRTFPQNP